MQYVLFKIFRLKRRGAYLKLRDMRLGEIPFIFLVLADARVGALVDDLCGEGELGHDVLFAREAIEGVVLGGDIDAVEGLDMGKIILQV